MKTRTLCIVALLAFAAGGTCPSDVNNDGVVGIQDFLQVLGDWGPCPEPAIVAIDGSNQGGDIVVRLWSDGRVELAIVDDSSGCYECGGTPVGQWIDMEAPTPSSQPVGLAAPHHIYVMYADGTTLDCHFELIDFNTPCGMACSILKTWTVLNLSPARNP